MFKQGGWVLWALLCIFIIITILVICYHCSRTTKEPFESEVLYQVPIRKDDYRIDTSKKASMYLTTSNDKCDEETFYRRPKWFHAPNANMSDDQKAKARAEMEEYKKAYLTNCKIPLDAWYPVWKGDGSAPIAKAQNNRGSYRDWLWFGQPITDANSGEPLNFNPKVMINRGRKMIAGKEHWLMNLRDNIDVNTIGTSFCNGEVHPFNPPTEDGIYIELTGYPNPTGRYVKYNTYTSLYDAFFPFFDDELKSKTKSVDGKDSEITVRSPREVAVRVHIYMPNKCGNAFLFREYRARFRFKRSAVLKKVPITDERVTGVTPELKQKIVKNSEQMDVNDQEIEKTNQEYVERVRSAARNRWRSPRGFFQYYSRRRAAERTRNAKVGDLTSKNNRLRNDNEFIDETTKQMRVNMILDIHRMLQRQEYEIELLDGLSKKDMYSYGEDPMTTRAFIFICK